MNITYIRTDFVRHLKAGGSVAHIKGVITAMERLGHTVSFISAGELPSIPAEKTTIISPGILRYAIFGVGNYFYNLLAAPRMSALIKKQKPDLIYHRYSLLSTIAIRLGKKYHIPVILEFNGSEVWVAKNWNIPLFSLKLVAAQEKYCLENATSVVVVSQVMKDNLIAQGIPDEKILVNPNGADIEEYRAGRFSAKEKNALRKELGISPSATVIGFIGTFGQWHGVPDIVVAAHLLREQKKLPEDVRFLLVGDGITMPEVKKNIALYELEKWFVLPGIIKQAQAAEYLSLFDIAVNPTVPNKDGTEFFGSPTKLFEYMALELPIISSALGQMKDIFEDGKDGLLFPPTDNDAFAAAIHTLITDTALRRKLGERALEKVTKTYTWEQNVTRALTFTKGLPS